MANPRNNRSDGVTKFCLAMEEHRRTEVGRVRTPKEFVACFFSHDDSEAKDRVFCHMPREIRGPIVAKWGIRGAKAALRDDDDRIKTVVHDALLSGDIDDAVFEEGVEAAVLIDWVPLAEWWSFWRNGKLTGAAIQRALATARELTLIDDKWFLANVEGRGGKLKGTDVICDALSKDQIVAWMRRVHESGDGSPAGLVAALGWETILSKTAQDALLFALDAFARKAGLVSDVEETTETKAPDGLKPPQPSPNEATTAKLKAIAEAPESQPNGIPPARDSGFPVSVPELPVEERGSLPAEAGPDTPVVAAGAGGWTGGAIADESPKLVEARARMLEMLEQTDGAPPKREPWDESEVPAKPSSLEWPEPAPISAHLLEEEPKIPAGPPPLPKKPALPKG